MEGRGKLHAEPPLAMFEYVSISRLLLKAPTQYGMSFLYTETDEFDATYFLLYQLKIIRREIEDLMAFLRRKMAEVRDTLQLLRGTDLNHRQVALTDARLATRGRRVPGSRPTPPPTA